MKRGELPLAFLLLTLALMLRLIAIDADPPIWLSWSAGLFSDEGIYSEDARLWALFGQHMRGDFHASIIAPLQNVVLVGIYHKFGCTLITTRMASVLFSMATLVCFWQALRNWYSRAAALAGLAMLSVSAPFVLYNRMGLLETPAVFWLTAGFLAMSHADIAERKWARRIGLFAAGLLSAVAVIWKGTFLLAALPVWAFALWRYRASGLLTIAGAALTLGLYFACWYLPNLEELARVNNYYLLHQYLPHTLGTVWFNIHRGLATGEDDGVVPFTLLKGALLPLCLIGFLTRRLRGNETYYENPDDQERDWLLWLWLLVPVAAFLFSSYTPSRYYVIFWPALVALAARAVTSGPARQRAPQLALFAVVFAANICILGISLSYRSYTLRDTSRMLGHVLPNDSWVAGQFAPSLCLDNYLRSMYVQKGLANDSADTLITLPITHVLATQVDSPRSDPWAGQYNKLIYAPAGLKTVHLGPNYTINVYANTEALP